MDCKIISKRIGIVPEQLTPDEIANNQYSPKKKGIEKWMEEAQRAEMNLPWENGGKEPSEYTWEEFEGLTPEQQEDVINRTFHDAM